MTAPDQGAALAPTDKVGAAAGAAALVAVAAWVLESLGVHVPATIQTDLAVLVVLAAAYIKTERGALRDAVARRAGAQRDTA